MYACSFATSFCLFLRFTPEVQECFQAFASNFVPQLNQLVIVLFVASSSVSIAFMKLLNIKAPRHCLTCPEISEQVGQTVATSKP